MNMDYLLFGVVAACMIAAVIYSILRNRKIRANGLIAEAVVSRMETDISTDADGDTTTTETYYVQYQTADGQRVEAVLGNPPFRTYEGMRLRVQYLPEKPKYVLAVKEKKENA